MTFAVAILSMNGNIFEKVKRVWIDKFFCSLRIVLKQNGCKQVRDVYEVVGSHISETYIFDEIWERPLNIDLQTSIWFYS